MHLRLSWQWAPGFIAAYSLAHLASAAVTLFYNNSTAPVTINAAAGTSFSVPVRLTTTDGANDQVEGLTYQVSGTNVSGIISFSSRVIPASSPFQFANAPTNPPPAALNPNNGTDLGASENDISMFVSTGTYDMSTVTFAVATNAPAGTYTLSFASNAAYSHPLSTSSTSIPSSSLGTLKVFVPEPASVISCASACGVLLMRRRRVA